MKEVLISGGAGFIGSHLLEELIKNKDYNITIVDDLSTGKVDNLINLRKYVFEFSIKKIQNYHPNKQFDIIYHLAAKANTREKGLKDFEDNIMATEAITKLLKPDGHLYFSSSCAVYGNQKFVTEESHFHPISPYGYSKWMNELTIQRNCKNWAIFRFSNVFGPRQDGASEMGLIGVIKYHLDNDKVMKVFNKGENHRDFIYVKDVVKALTTINKKDIFQIGRNKTYKVLDLIKLTVVKWEFGKINNEVESIKLDNSKIKKEGWEPSLSIIDYIGGFKR